MVYIVYYTGIILANDFDWKFQWGFAESDRRLIKLIMRSREDAEIPRLFNLVRAMMSHMGKMET